MQVRVKLYILSFTGFMVNYMLRTDLNIAILAMARQDVSDEVVPSTMPPNYNMTQNVTILAPEVVEPKQVRKHMELHVEIFFLITRSFFIAKVPEFNWTNREQNNLQTGFYWWYFISSGVSGGIITKLGPTKTFGYGQLISGCGSLLIPLLAAENSIYVFLLRSIQGFAEVR